MAYNRKRTSRRTRRKTYRRRRTARRVAYKTNLVSITRMVKFSDIAISGTWSCPGYYFTLSQLPSYTEFTNLFEQYRINAVKLTFQPYYNSMDTEGQIANAAAGIAYNNIPRLYTLVDKDGAITATTENGMLEYASARFIRNPMKSFSVYVKSPCVQIGTANSLSIVGGAPKGKVWLDCDNYNIQHWGCAVGGLMPAPSSAFNTIGYSVVAKFYMQFRKCN